MKNLIKRLVMGAMVFGMTTAMAQKGGEKVKLTPEQKIDKKIERLDKELNLDFKQKESIKASSLNQLKEREMLKKEKE
jgi:protein CpxP